MRRFGLPKKKAWRGSAKPVNLDTSTGEYMVTSSTSCALGHRPSVSSCPPPPSAPLTGGPSWTSPRCRAAAGGSSGSDSWTSSLPPEDQSAVNIGKRHPAMAAAATSCLSSWLSMRSRSRALMSSPSFRLLWRSSLMYSHALDKIPPLLCGRRAWRWEGAVAAGGVPARARTHLSRLGVIDVAVGDGL